MTDRDMLDKKDAERYRWLRSKHRECINDDMDNVGAIDSIMVCTGDGCAEAVDETDLDDVVDKAMRTWTRS